MFRKKNYSAPVLHKHNKNNSEALKRNSPQSNTGQVIKKDKLEKSLTHYEPPATLKENNTEPITQDIDIPDILPLLKYLVR